MQLILDEGAEEYVLTPPVEDADVLQDLFDGGESPAFFDTSRKILMFGVQATGHHHH